MPIAAAAEDRPMMIPERPSLERRVLAALDGSAGGRPAHPGRARRLRQRPHVAAAAAARSASAAAPAQYVDIERIATTPERFCKSLRERRRFRRRPTARGRGARPARATRSTRRSRSSTRRARPAATPATFLLDEFLELRTFESFPGLRTRAARPRRRARLERQPLRADDAATRRARTGCCATRRRSSRSSMCAPLSAGGESARRCPAARATRRTGDARMEEAKRARARRARAAGAGALRRPSRLRARDRRDRDGHGVARHAPIPSARCAALLAPGGELAQTCRFSYELRLHRARGYGALKAILDVLAEEEPLTLTEIALRLRRTPGSTKDYLSWLEDVDLIVVAAEALQLRRSDAAAVGPPALPAGPADRGRHRPRGARLRARTAAAAEPALALAGAQPDADRDKSWGIIEID